MEEIVVNSFLDQFIAIADAGFGLIQGDVHFVLNALIVISVVLAGAQWALAQEAPIGPFFRKVLFVGFFAFLVNNWNALTTVINRSGAELGLKAGGGQMSLPDLHDPGAIAAIGPELFGKTVALCEGMSLFTDPIPMATIFVSACLVLIAFFVLALQIFVALIAFKLGALAAFVALPWGVFNGTAWVAERPLGWVAGSAVRLFILALIASVAVNFVDTLPQTFTLDAGGVLNVFLFGLTILALAWFGPMLASEVVQGQPHLSGADQVRAGQGAIVTSIGAGFLAYRTGQGVIGGVGALAGAAGRIGGAAGRRFGDGGGTPSRPGVNYAAIQPPKSGRR